MLYIAGTISSFPDSAAIASKLGVDESTVVFQMVNAHKCWDPESKIIASEDAVLRLPTRKLFAVSTASMQMRRVRPRQRANGLLR